MSIRLLYALKSEVQYPRFQNPGFSARNFGPGLK